MRRALLTPDECDWESSSRGALRETSEEVCCESYECSRKLHNSTWTQTISDLRKHYSELDRDGKRWFIAARTHYNPPKQHGDLRGKQVYTHFIEKPEIMAERMLDLK